MPEKYFEIRKLKKKLYCTKRKKMLTDKATIKSLERRWA